jgi:signal transduction histidine kinase
MKLEEINLELERLFTHELEENRRKEALIRYQARMAAMGEMIGNIAHQWRQPLNALRLILTNLQDAGQDPEYTVPAFKRAHALIEKMSDTIDDFRYFSKPRSEPKLFQIGDALKVVLGLAEENMRVSGVTVKTDVSRISPIYGLENQLSHVLFNLLSNSLDALKTMPADAERVITVSGYEEGGFAVVTVSDTGPGIPRELADRIFDIYFTTRESEGGTGLGLYMARAIVEESFQGTIRLTDRKPGTTFEIRIPVSESQENNRDRSQ